MITWSVARDTQGCCRLQNMGTQMMLKLYCCIIFPLTAAVQQNRTFMIDYDNDTFVKDGQPFRYISGSIHYTRVPHQYWDDRLHKMAAAGLNAIQTYVPWNAHEPRQGEYDFEGQQDIVTFLKTAQSYNLAVVLRPGPYICAEWEFGGLPAWLLKYDNMKVRTSDPNYVNAVKIWLRKLYSVLKPLLYKNGGPIITIQIENEYGSYPACDYDYLTTLRDLTWSLLGNDVVLFSTDGDDDGYLKCGTIPGVYVTVDFGVTYSPEKNFAIQRHKEPKGPLVNSEYYTGWLDHWGQNHSTVPTPAVAISLDLMLALGANVNMYMFEGGTNFGFWNGPCVNLVTPVWRENIEIGANYPFQPVPTSYDYDAPLSEAGDITDKYLQLRNVITKFNPTQMKIPPSTQKFAYGKVNLMFVETVVSYVNGTSQPVRSVYPVNMEALDHYYGFMLYGHQLTKHVNEGDLDLAGVRDRAYVMVGRDDTLSSYGVVERDSSDMTVKISGGTGDILYILVENQARINYGGEMDNNCKGLIMNVTLDGEILLNWLHYPVKLDKDAVLNRTRTTQFGARQKQARSGTTRVGARQDLSTPAIYAGLLTIQSDPMDTYIDMSVWTKGQLFVNGENLGRYWPHMGPQVRLYIPKYALKTGKNNIALLELEALQIDPDYVMFCDQPLINATVPPSSYHRTTPYNDDRMVYRGNLTAFTEKPTVPAATRKPLHIAIYDIVMKVISDQEGNECKS